MTFSARMKIQALTDIFETNCGATYQQLCVMVRRRDLVWIDETGWRVAAHLQLNKSRKVGKARPRSSSPTSHPQPSGYVRPSGYEFRRLLNFQLVETTKAPQVGLELP